jgi:streptogramin lyase
VATQGAGPLGLVRVELLDPRTGASRSTFAAPRAPGVNELVVESDGVTVFCGTDRKLAWASPKAPAVHPIPRARCPTATALAGRRVAYVNQYGGVWIAGLNGRRLRLVSPSTLVREPRDPSAAPRALSR